MKSFVQSQPGRLSPILFFLLMLCCLSVQSQRMRSNLLIVDNNGTTLMDGNMTNYGSQWSNLVDGYDIWKMSNFSENFGILRTTANLVIERRSLIVQNDTTYFRMWNMQQRNYRIQVITENLHLSNLTAFVQDTYLNQNTPIGLNDTTNVNFSVVSAQAGSYASNRFRLIYLPAYAATLPVTFTGIQVSRRNNLVNVGWTVENEYQMEKYVVEHSATGANFTEIKELASANSSIKQGYTIEDNQAATGNHFYRIKGISLSGKVQYSAIARISAPTKSSDMNVYPNPVVNKQMQLQLNITDAGTYRLSLIQSNGTRQELGALPTMAIGQSVQSVSLPANLQPGVYRIQLTGPAQTVINKTIFIQ